MLVSAPLCVSAHPALGVETAVLSDYQATTNPILIHLIHSARHVFMLGGDFI